jgi:hypothetical protein
VTYTDDYRRRVNRKLDRANERKRRHGEEVERVLDAMRRGASLRQTRRPHRTLWSLSTGKFITKEVAASVRQSANVVGVGDCLFGSGEISQTFRHTGEK